MAHETRTISFSYTGSFEVEVTADWDGETVLIDEAVDDAWSKYGPELGEGAGQTDANMEWEQVAREEQA